LEPYLEKGIRRKKSRRHKESPPKGDDHLERTIGNEEGVSGIPAGTSLAPAAAILGLVEILLTKLGLEMIVRKKRQRGSD